MTDTAFCGGGDSPRWYEEDPLGEWEAERDLDQAGAALQLVINRRRGLSPDPELEALAREKPGTCPDPGEEARHAARAAAETRQQHLLEIARAQLRVVLDRRAGRKSEDAWLRLAQEKD